MNYSSLSALWRRLVWLTVWLLPVFGASTALAQTFLPVDEAFRLEVRASGPRAVQVSFVQAPGVYLYREQMTATWRAAGGAEQPLGWDLPPAESKFDPNFEKTMEVYHQSIQGGLTLPADARGEAVLTLGYQGCADAGLCYPPQTWEVPVDLATWSADAARAGTTEGRTDDGSATPATAAQVAAGKAHFGRRMIAALTGGEVEGERLSGRVMPSGGDWATIDDNDTLRLDARITMETHDGALIYVSYRGVLVGRVKELRVSDREVTAELEITASDQWQEMIIAPERLINRFSRKPMSNWSSVGKIHFLPKQFNTIGLFIPK